jgi:hypothetical protein
VSDWDLVDHVPEQGLKVYHGYDEDTDSVLVKHEFAAAATHQVLDRNKAVASDGWNRREDMWHAAHIPIQVQFEWITKHGVDCWNPDHKDGVKRLLNSSEYAHCRTRHFII